MMMCERCKQVIEQEGREVPPIDDLEISSLPFLDAANYSSLPPCSAVYFAYSQRGICYIGEAVDLNRRWQNHAYGPRLLDEKGGCVAWVPVADRSERKRYELQAIHRFRPLWNRGGAEFMDTSEAKHRWPNASRLRDAMKEGFLFFKDSL